MAEVGLAAFSSIVSEGSKSLFKLIIRQISYVFKHQSYIDGLKDQVKQLGYRRETVQQPVNHARLQGDEIYEGVTDWLNKVDEFISEGVAKSIIDDEDRAKKSCFKGLCPNLISRYQLSKQAAKAAEAAASLEGKGTFSSVSYRPAPKSTEYMPVKDYEAFDSRTKVFQDVVDALKDDSFKIIGVYGMGGVGKTTLVKQVRKQVMEDKLFDKVVMAEVTQTPDHHKIQDKLAFDLGMEFHLNENEFQRASRLCQRLKQEKRLLIILDNIWTKLEFDKVGIPYGDVDEKDREDDRSRRTIILTSRSRDLLCNDMNSQKNFWIDALSKDEALQLFEKIVGDSKKTYDFRPTTDEIVEKCGGLPVALRTVASALKNKSLASWKDALNQLRSSNLREIRGMDADVYTSIKLSYDFLESDEAKSLFLLCGLHREGHLIHVHYLLRYGMGLGLFRNVYTLEAVRNRVDALIDSLKASCLLLDGDAEDEAKMHDVIHVVAVSIAAEKLMFNIPNVADFDREMEETIREGPIAISLPYRDIQELPERLECPQLKLLLLFSKRDSSLQISDLFFEGTEELKVLDFTRIFFSSLPSSLGCLINVQTLCLDGCRLNDITIIGQLRKLEILSFRDSDVKELPLVIGQLTRLQLLDLSNCSSLVVIAPNVISKLSRLEELYIGNSFSQWEKVEGGSNASLVELIGLSKLTTLEIHVRDAEILPQDLVSVELQSYKICIGNKWWSSWSVKSGLSRLMKLQGLEKFGILLQNYRMKLLLKRTEYLYLEELKGVQNVVHELDDGEGFPRLKHLWVNSCSEILHIVGSVGRVRRKVFPLLESLSLWCLSKLETICDSQLTEDQSFSNLRIIIVRSCDKLKHLFSFSMAKNLLRLQKVEVLFGGDLEMIVGSDREKPTTSLGFNEIIADDDTAPKVILPSLEELNLAYLINMKKLWADHNQGMYCCQNLTKLHVVSCHRMKYLFSYSMVNSLLQLQHLEIRACKSMEGVVDTTGWSEREEGHIHFPKLHSLELHCLPELTSFANTGHIHSDSVVEFPSLLNLKIRGCSNMLRFISTSSPEDTIHSEMQPPPLFDEKVRLPRLEVLRMEMMDNLRRIWHHQLASESFSKLKNLDIWWCDNLRNIFPPLVGIPSSLVNLKVSGCPKLEEIVGHVGQEVKENRIAFSKLKVLILDDLPRLTSFCLENYTLEFPSLERVSMTHCPNMKNFSHGILSIPKPCKVQVTEKEEGELHHWEGNNLSSTIQKCYDEMIGFLDINRLQLSHFPRLQEIWHGQALPVSFFNNLAQLVVDDCTNMSSAIPANLLRCLNNLEWLEVRNCDSIEEVFHFEELNADKEHIGLPFPKLSELRLIDLPKLKRFCNFTGNIIEPPKLENLTIENCPDMETFISNSVVHVTTDNKKPEKLTSEENFLLAHQVQPLFDDKVAFPKLRKLRLSRLHKVQHLWKENAESNKVFANLESLKISECSKLQKLVPPSWHLENLEALKVSKCHRLINVLTFSTSESLVNLQRMKIADCKMIEEIIQSQVGEEAKDCIVFRELEYLTLDCLPSLTSFSLGNYALEFPSLKQVVVRQCPKMKIFSQGLLDTPMLNKVNVTEEEKDDDDEGCWEGNLNDTIKKLFNEMNSKEEIEPILQVQ
ncbi:AAA domain-containing protein [Citrus sinensis]|uniref:disease resistance protein At4g27190-like n=1 Tax=Citrus sinensis TaxID=2711 RepID=UPI00219EF0FF|nr:disease resistance protein At4g27190-like [Citrus sinensis]XP_052297536.1 disease resistance protein At4g27190-like [Citrus sinensis]KAH9687125.1 AAA domain-containing protein [Citrus sinensis]